MLTHLWRVCDSSTSWINNKGNCWWHFRFYLHHYIINWFAKFYDPKANEWEMEGWREETSLQAWFDIGRLRKEVDKGTTLLSSFRLVDFQDDKTDLPKLNERFGFRDSLPHMEIPTRTIFMLLCRYREQSRQRLVEWTWTANIDRNS